MPKRKFSLPPRLTESVSSPGVPSVPPTIPHGAPCPSSGDPSCSPRKSSSAPPDFSSATPAAKGVKSAGNTKNGKSGGHYKDAFREALGKCFTYGQKRELFLMENPVSGVDIAYRLCRDLGATVADLASFFEISQTRMEYWLANIPELRDAYVRGRDECDSRKVESKLFTKTQGYDYQEIIKERAWFMDPITGLKSPGELVVTKEITKHLPPDTLSIIYWLKNRSKDRWRDAQEHDVSLKGKMTFEINSLIPEPDPAPSKDD